MPSPYLTYALAALSFGLAVGFYHISDENTQLAQAKIAFEMEATAFREKYNGEVKARQYAEAALTIAETSERAVRNELAHETKARQIAENAKQTIEAELVATQEKLGALNAKLIEAGLAAPAAQGDAKDSHADAAPAAGQLAAEASMAPRRSWWSFLGF
jgi:Tfp pilus assembly protein FimV